MNRSKFLRVVYAAAIVFIAALFVVIFMDYLIDRQHSFVPDYEKIDLSDSIQIVSDNIEKEVLGADGGIWKKESEEVYKLIFEQTGLGRSAVDRIVKESSSGDLAKVKIDKHQRDFFQNPDIGCDKIGIITHEERLRDEGGQLKKGISFADVRNGDIFLSFATHSLGWRHGHAAIVIDTENNVTMEAVLWGHDSEIQNISKWGNFPTVMQLRLKEESIIAKGHAKETIGDKIAKLANDTVNGIPYGLLTGIPIKYEEKLSKTQCAHLVWHPYKSFGYDIDSDSGWLVTPKDISKSDNLEIIQIFGIDPRELD